MADWTPTPFAGHDGWTAERLQPAWQRLHHIDAEPWPADPALQQAWVMFHNGEFQRAAAAGVALGDAGTNVASKATCIYANHVEPREQRRQNLLLEAAERAEALQASQPDNVGGFYWQAYALGRYSQGISVAKALTQGLGVRIRRALQTALSLQPQHIGSHLSLAVFHAEVIDKVGGMVGHMTYGAEKSQGLALYRQALALDPDSIVTLSECANGLVMLEGPDALTESTQLLNRAVAIAPMDAMERLYVASARAALEG